MKLEINEKVLHRYCRSNGIKKLSLFGSYLKNTQTEESDVDLLVEFEDDKNFGLLDVARIERELAELFGKRVDLRTPAELSRYFKDDVVKEAEVKYENLDVEFMRLRMQQKENLTKLNNLP